jgi:hypothetical protein
VLFFLAGLFVIILYSSSISSVVVTILAFPFLIRLLHQIELLLYISQGIANTSFHCSNAKFAVIKVPDFSADSITITPEEIQETISFLIGKL